MRTIAPVILVAAILTNAIVPAMAAPNEPQCLRQSMVNGWKVLDDQTLIVNDRSRRQYTVSLAKGCFGLKWPMHLGFSAGTGFGLSCIGPHDFLYVPASGGMPSQRCVISDVQPYGAGALHAQAGN